MLVYFSVPDSSHLLIDSQQKTIFAEEIFILYIAVPYHLPRVFAQVAHAHKARLTKTRWNRSKTDGQKRQKCAINKTCGPC